MSIEIVPPEKWAEVVPDFALEGLPGTAVNVQCLQSSDFVIGTQTNFNGPVTIVNCGHRLDAPAAAPEAPGKLVIWDRVLSLEATAKVREMAMQKREGREGRQKFFFVSAKRKIPRRKLWWILASVSFCLGTAVAVASGLVFADAGPPPEQKDSFLDCTPLAADSCLYNNALRPGAAKPLDLPVPYVVVTQTTWRFCYEKHACLEAAQEFMEEQELSPCNFLLGGDGNVYRDRGWLQSTVGGGVGKKTLKICFMGDYSDDFPTYPQILAAQYLVGFGVAHDFVAENYTLAAVGGSPRATFDPIYEVVKKWPHFKENLSR